METGLKIRDSKDIVTPQGNYKQITEFNDYRTIEGIRYPFKIKQYLGNQTLDFTIETISNKNGQFIFLAVTRKNNIIKCYSDGILTEETQAHKELMTAKKNIDQDDSIWSLYSNNTELRLTEGVAREEANMLFARK